MCKLSINGGVTLKHKKHLATVQTHDIFILFRAVEMELE